MQTLDWTIVGAFAAFLVVMAVVAKRYNKSVADFLVANRSAGRYLLTITGAATWLAGANIIAAMQRGYTAGFCGVWWLVTLIQPILLLLALTGWVRYRYRETRAMTMAQMLEVRYSRRFRIFCGIVAWTSGVINMGVQPAVTSLFIIYYFGLPPTFPLWGFEAIPTFPAIIFCELVAALLIIMMGGMIVVAITDFFQGIFCIVALLAILGSLAMVFDWNQVFEALGNSPEGASRLNPFETTKAKDFGLVWFMLFAFGMLYGSGTFLGAQGYQGAAKSAHESKMAAVLGSWRYTIQTGLIVLLPISVFVFMEHPAFRESADQIRGVLTGITEDDKLASQLRAPLAMLRFLPAGIIGLFGAFFIAATISTDDTFLHSWGSILVQDVILPFRKKGVTPKQHMRMLRGAMVFVAVLVFLISFFWKNTEYLFMWFSMSAAIFSSGAGICVIGALYWKRGTTKAAWAGMLVGTTLAVTGVLLSTLWKSHLSPWVLEAFPSTGWLSKDTGDFFLNGIWIAFYSSISALTTYVLISLYDWLVLNRPPFNLDRFLHRGKYAIKGEHEAEVTRPPTGWRAMLPTGEYSTWDKFLHFGALAWALSALTLGAVTAIVHLVREQGISDQYWMGFWKYVVYSFGVLGVITTVWFFCGGVRDIRRQFKKLGSMKRNDLDDGRVVDHHSLADDNLEKNADEAT